MTHYRIFKGKKAIRKGNIKDQCYRKNKYTLKEARQTANSLRKSGRIKEARIYECFNGAAHWHIARDTLGQI